MANITIRVDTEPWTERLKVLGARANTALARALNRTAASERTAMARAVAKDLGVNVGTAREGIALKKAHKTNLVATLTAKGKRLPLIDFKARGPYPSLGRGRGVSYIGKGGTRKTISNAFIAIVTKAGEDGQHAGHRGVFQRVGNRRLPIKQLYGASVARVFGNLLPVGEARRNEVLLGNVAHEIEFELSRLTSST